MMYTVGISVVTDDVRGIGLGDDFPLRNSGTNRGVLVRTDGSKTTNLVTPMDWIPVVSVFNSR